MPSGVVLVGAFTEEEARYPSSPLRQPVPASSGAYVTRVGGARYELRAPAATFDAVYVLGRLATYALSGARRFVAGCCLADVLGPRRTCDVVAAWGIVGEDGAAAVVRTLLGETAANAATIAGYALAGDTAGFYSARVRAWRSAFDSTI